MIWVTWRQFRTQAWAAAALLVALGAALLATGPGLVHLYHTSGVAGCTGDACDQAVEAFRQSFSGSAAHTLFMLSSGVMYLLPPVVGAFWGAPMVGRELESGTFRLAWNQSVTRTRWLAVKLLGLGLLSMAMTGVASLAFGWWATPIFKVSHNQLEPELFGAHGVVPLAYAAFAFVVGVTVGLLSRRTVLAMGVTLALVVAAMVAMPLALREYLTTPVHVVRPLPAKDLHGLSMNHDGTRIQLFTNVSEPGAVVVSNRTTTASGFDFTGPGDPAYCDMNAGGNPEKCRTWLTTQGLIQDVRYITESRFWALQWAESGLFLGLAVLLGAGCFWWVRRRLA